MECAQFQPPSCPLVRPEKPARFALALCHTPSNRYDATGLRFIVATPFQTIIWRVMHETGKIKDLQFLEENSAAMRRAGVHLPHLDQRVNLLNYIRIADDVVRNISEKVSHREAQFESKTKALDWGCGYGQMTWLLKRRGLEVTSFDIGSDESALPAIPLCRDLAVIRATHPTNLSFPDNSFDAVLSCGVLEHVDECSGVPGSELKSLREIARVLRPNGKFLIYQLPQQLAWQEAVVRGLKLGYAHPRRYTEAEIIGILRSTGFHVLSVRRANFVPKNLTGLPQFIKHGYNRFSWILMALDRIMCKIPIVNRIAGVLEVVAVKAPDGSRG